MFNGIQSFLYSSANQSYLYQTISRPITVITQPIFTLTNYASGLLNNLIGRGAVYEDSVELPVTVQRVEDAAKMLQLEVPQPLPSNDVVEKISQLELPQPPPTSNDFIIQVQEEGPPVSELVVERVESIAVVERVESIAIDNIEEFMLVQQLPDDPFRNYITSNSPTIPFEDAEELANKGDEILREVFNNDNLEPLIPSKQEKVLSSIIWALMRQAIAKGQGFTEGTFIVKDPAGKLATYLSQAGYNRASSHLPTRAGSAIPFINSAIQAGVDIEHHPLPAGHKTVLLTPVDANTPQQTFLLKPEPHGCNWKTPLSVAQHTIGYAASVQRAGQAGANEQAGMRKERVPASLLEEFKKSLPKKDIKELAHAKIFGIRHMSNYISKLDKATKEPFLNLQNTFSQFDHLDVRTGNEVILEIK